MAKWMVYQRIDCASGLLFRLIVADNIEDAVAIGTALSNREKAHFVGVSIYPEPSTGKS